MLFHIFETRPKCLLCGQRLLPVLSAAEHPPQELSTDELSHIRHATRLYMLNGVRDMQQPSQSTLFHCRWYRQLSVGGRAGSHLIKVALLVLGTAQAGSSALQRRTVKRTSAVSWSATEWPGKTSSRKYGQWSSTLPVRPRRWTSSGSCT